jgi:hypothetical protein
VLPLRDGVYSPARQPDLSVRTEEVALGECSPNMRAKG